MGSTKKKQRKRVIPVALTERPHNADPSFGQGSPKQKPAQKKLLFAKADNDGSSSSSSDDEDFGVTLVKSPASASANQKRAAHMDGGSGSVADELISPRSDDQSKKRQILASRGSSTTRIGDGYEEEEEAEVESVDSDEMVMGGQNSDSEDDDEHDVPPKMEELSKKCWKCYVVLKDNPLYCLHVHPHLQVPICSVCVEEVTYPEDEANACVGCGEDPGDQFMCDACPRSCCLTCIAKAFGGGALGWRRAQSLRGEGALWKCPVCDPPSALKKVQNELNPSSDDEDQGAAEAPANRSAEEALNQLYEVEMEKRSLQALDDPEVLRAKEEEIRQELHEAKPQLSPSKLNILVQEELEVWRDICAKHDHRLGDMASSLQEELETVHDIDLAKFYKSYFSEDRHRQQRPGAASEEDEDEDDSFEEEEWKRTADRAIFKRERAEEKKREAEQEAGRYIEGNPLPDEVYEKEIPEEVEDLGTQSDDEKGCSGKGFRLTYGRPTKEKIQQAFAAEDELLAREKITIQHRYNDTLDVQENVREEMQTSRLGSGGRVRRDSYVEVMKVRRKRNASVKKSKQKAPAVFETAAPAVPEVNEEPQSVAVASVPEPVAQIEAKVTPKKQKAAVHDIVDLTEDTPKKKNTSKLKSVAKGETASSRESSMKEGANSKSSVDGDDLPDVYYCTTDPEYANSNLVLSCPANSTSEKRVKTIKVSTALEKHLKPHQKEGVQFLWRNAFADLNVRTNKEEDLHEYKSVGGAVLAHNMGLGKSLTAITTIYTAFHHPSLVDKTKQPLISSAILVVPVNTVSSWKSEFQKWTGKLNPSVLVFDLGERSVDARLYALEDWSKRGGILLVGKDLFAKLCKKSTEHSKLLLSADCLFIDESHMMLSNKKSAIYKALSEVKTKRKVLLTGTPFQNNVLEYYRMIHFIRPGVLDTSESKFEREFAIPIMGGMARDSSAEAVRECDLKSAQLKEMLKSYVHRKDAGVLRQELPPMQQVVLHLRPTRMQTKLLKELKRFEKRKNITNFLIRMQHAKPICSHPAVLLASKAGTDSDADDSDEATVTSEGGAPKKQPWWQRFVEKQGVDKVKAVENGPKIVLLLHILAHSTQVGDKVVVFSQCLRTLDFLENVLESEWVEHVASLASAFPGMRLGGWTKGVEYLRIDGAVDSESRGSLIEQFNDLEKTVKVFLISAKAGGIGITLNSANRCVLLDSHFNPTVMTQALYRCYRFGQTKPVFAYRFLTEGTGEEKIYSRSVNKTGVSLRLLDGKNIERSFSTAELSNMVLNDQWVQCDKCEKWRMLIGEDEENLPEKWYCSMNKNDPLNNTCDAIERDQSWYYRKFELEEISTADPQPQSGNDDSKEQCTVVASPAKIPLVADDELNTTCIESEEKKAILTQNDEILMKLLNDPDTSKHVSNYCFHEALLEPIDDEDVDESKSDESMESESELLDAKPAAKKPSKTSTKKRDSKPPPATKSKQPGKISSATTTTPSKNQAKSASKPRTPSKSGSSTSPASTKSSPRFKQTLLTPSKAQNKEADSRKHPGENVAMEDSPPAKRARNEVSSVVRKSTKEDTAQQKKRPGSAAGESPSAKRALSGEAKGDGSSKLPSNSRGKSAPTAAASVKREPSAISGNGGNNKEGGKRAKADGRSEKKSTPIGVTVVELLDSSSDEE